MNVCIKGIREKDWRYFKSEAAKAGMTLGEYFSIVVSREKERS